MAAETFGIAASALAVVELSAKVVQKCTQYTQGVLGAKADIERITGEVKGLGELAMTIKRLSDEHPGKLKTLQEQEPLFKQCHSRLGGIEESLGPSERPGKRYKAMSRLGVQALMWPFKSKDTEKIIADVHRLTQLLSDAMQVDQTAILLDIDQRAILEKLPVADGAAYDSHANEHSPQCLPNTRVEVLREITQWAEDPSTKPVFWLSGMAGTGKSTIARTLAFIFNKKGSLGATFFFKRGEGDRGEASKLFTTISSQLIRQIPSMAGHVQLELQTNNGICSQALQTQFKKLIKEPVSKVSSSNSISTPCLIIVDALDECEWKDIETLIQLFSEQESGPVQLKFFLTSRPEIPARVGFNTINGHYQTCILHNVAKPLIERDITAYFEHELGQIRLRFNKDTVEPGRQLPTNWPAEADLLMLTNMATPLFIFASTVCRFIANDRLGGPDQQLNRVLKYQSRSQESKLDATYLPILDQMVEGLAPRDLELITQRFRQIVGSIVTVAYPLSVSALARLIVVPAETINDVLRMLHSVLDIPKSWQQPIRMLHSSFREFLFNQERQQGPFWIDEKEMHRQLALACLEILKSSRIKAWRPQDPIIKNRLMSSDRVSTHMPAEVRYACRFWVSHVQESVASDSLAPHVREFCMNHILPWIEALSWIGELPNGFNMMKTLHSVFTRESNRELLVLLEGSMRFVQAAVVPLLQDPNQTYALASAFSPINTINRDLYEKDLAEWAFMGRQKSLISDQYQLIHGKRTISIKSITFSPNGELISFAAKDSSVIVCSANTGEHFQMLAGHAGAINAVSFSSDNSLIASASSDATVILWSVQSARRVQTLRGHSESVDAIGFSPNGRFFVSKSALPQIVLWTVDTAGHWRMLRSHLSQDMHWGVSDTQNLLFSIDTDEEYWALNRTISGQRECSMRGHCSSNVSAVESVGLYTSTHLAGTCGILSQTRNVTILRRSNESDQSRTFQTSAQIGTVVRKPNGQLAISVFTNSTVILWASHPAEILYAKLVSDVFGGAFGIPSSQGTYPSDIMDTTEDRTTLIAFSPDSSQVACIIR